MLELTPRLVRLVIIPASCLAFFAGMVLSGAAFYHGKPFDAKKAIISDLESPDQNPHGYVASASGTAVSGILLVPAVILFVRRLRKGHPKLALAGALMFTLGLGAAIATGILAPFTRGYTPLHVQLASAAFIGICCGTLVHLIAARAAPTLLSFQFGVLLLLIYLCYGPVSFNNDRLLTGLAFWEWVLCLSCAGGLWALAKAIEADGEPEHAPTDS